MESVFTHIFERVSDHFFGQMTKVVAVLRHAQSAGRQTGQPDCDRILTVRGQAAARTLSQRLKQQRNNFQFILSGSSTRTLQTAALLNESMELPVEKIQFKDELYEALMVHWLDYIYELPEEINNVLLLGHNPWLSMLASSFAGSIRELARYELTAFEFESKSGRKNGDMCREIMNVK